MPSQVEVSHPYDGVGLLLFENAPMNFLTAELGERIEQGLREVRESGAKVVVLASKLAGYFIAHMALDEVLAMNEGRPLSGDIAAIGRCGRELRSGPMISIALNQGQAWGGGCELFATANLRVAGESASFCQPESLFGLMAAGGGTSRLPRLIGEARALEFVLDGRPIGARKALQWGLVNRVYPDARASEQTLRWAAWIASRPASALMAARKSILLGLDQASFREAVASEARIYSEFTRLDVDERLRRIRAGLSRYRAGGDSFDAWGLDPNDLDA